jgi:hypothetical protein
MSALLEGAGQRIPLDDQPVAPSCDSKVSSCTGSCLHQQCDKAFVHQGMEPGHRVSAQLFARNRRRGQGARQAQDLETQDLEPQT